jgi:hypothetical protein
MLCQEESFGGLRAVSMGAKGIEQQLPLSQVSLSGEDLMELRGASYLLTL